MIRTKEFIAVFSLVAILACSSLAGAQANDANLPLTFEVSPVKWSAPNLTYSLPTEAYPMSWRGTVAYVVGIPYRRDSIIGDSAMDRVVSRVRDLDVSEKQRSFLNGLDGTVLEMKARGLQVLYTPPDDPNSTQVLLYAVSLEDAKKMAQWYVQQARDSFNGRAAYNQTYIEEMTEAVAGMQQKLSELTESEEAARKALDEAKRQVPYRSVEQALDASAELDKLLNTALVEIAGIQAALTAIQDRMKPGAFTSQLQDLKGRLEAMLVEQSISLYAAEARKRKATELRKQADAYMDLMQALSRITSEKETLAKDLAEKSDNLQGAQGQYLSLLQREPKVIENKAFIYPVKQGD